MSVDLPHGEWGRSDSEGPLRQCIKELRGLGFEAHLFIGDSTSQPIIESVKAHAPFDCVFIDANHTENNVRTDFTNYGRLGKYVCFHDIAWKRVPKPTRLPIEVPKVWADIKQTFKDKAKFREISHHHDDNGIGILEWI